MRGLIIGVAAMCYATALVVVWAAVRVPAAPPAPALSAPPAATPIPLQPLPPPQSPPAPAAVASSQLPAGRTPATVEDLAREQATSRQVVDELRATVARLQEEIARRSADPIVNEPHGRTVAMFCCDLLPAGQETLDPKVREVLRAVLPEIMTDDRQIVSVEGHTDSRPILNHEGKPFKDNADLSLLRARAVAALLQQYGIAAGRIRIKGWGDTRPLATNDTAEGRDRNRRVEIQLLPPAAQR